ncbi:MAG: methyltransferase domain-containing protein [Deltaproteobacteria bacterium]|jgi:SAM-dependent methyltransferase|nr:methyltransferase domain-containing protein [Deltaproteobacteria bacterium]MBW2520041.1 methyltransferase domain-containing protein [Deltaproteobacteria bacterium]
MHRQLLDLVVCPGCLPEERPLAAHIQETRQGDIYTATLTCPGCRKNYPIDHGMACLLPQSDLALVGKYTELPVVSAYLWSHFADLFDDPDQNTAYLSWSSMLNASSGVALDTGCAVGRLTFELARNAELAVGIDRSHAFIQTARLLTREGRLSFDLIMEGELTEHREVRLPHDWPLNRVEFVLADALALPFPKSVFQCSSSLNLLDKLPAPLKHLDELNRVTSDTRAQLLVADPWSWSTEIAPKTAWLGGVPSGSFAGHAHINVRHLLENKLLPAWKILDEGTIQWTIRNHRNHFERIHSDYLLAQR